MTDRNIKTVTVPDTVKAYGKTYKVTEIGIEACKGLSKLTKVTIGKNVKKIGKNAFTDCGKLKTLIIKTKNLTASGIGAGAFSKIYSKPTVTCPKEKLDLYQKILPKKGMPKKAKYRKQ